MALASPIPQCCLCAAGLRFAFTWQGISMKEDAEPYTYVTETGEKYEVRSVTFKFGKKVEVC